jgi:hypothetical protein
MYRIKKLVGEHSDLLKATVFRGPESSYYVSEFTGTSEVRLRVIERDKGDYKLNEMVSNKQNALLKIQELHEAEVMQWLEPLTPQRRT